MKKFLLIILILAIANTYGQNPNTLKFRNENNLHTIADRAIPFNSVNAMPPQDLSKFKPFSFISDKSVSWNWTTITTFDDSNTNKNKYTQTLNSLAKPAAIQIDEWTNNSWNNFRKKFYTYDASGRLLETLGKIWTDNNWVIYERETYTYNDNGKITNYLDEYWSQYNNSWSGNLRRTYTYDANGNQLTDILECYLTYYANWEFQTKATYRYDSKGNKLTKTNSIWDGNSWNSDERDTYTYDANGNQITDLYETYSGSTWDKISRYSYTYDASGKVLSCLEESFANNVWSDYIKLIPTYDASGKIMTQLYQKWETIEWDNYSKYTYTYDANGNSQAGKFELWNANAWTTATAKLSLFSGTYDIYSIPYIYRYEANFAAGIEQNKNKNIAISIFPNPASDIIKIKLNKPSKANAVIYNIAGTVIYSEILDSESAEVNVSTLHDGLYLLKINVNDIISTQKIIIKH